MFYNYAITSSGQFASMMVNAYGYTSGLEPEDWFFVSLLDSAQSNFTSTGSFIMTFSTDVLCFDDYVGAAWSNWTVNGNALADGQLISAGTHTFAWNLNNVVGVWTGASSAAGVSLRFVQAPASAIPLPGAAGLAACGLLGLSRRRRR